LLKYRLIPKKKKIQNDTIKTNLFNFKLSNPIGLAAGFDKNAEALPGLIKQSFSFIEVGTVTPMPQYGNIKPRVFRIPKNQSIINSLGFPNLGAIKVHHNLTKIRKYHPLGKEPLVGVNIGYNKNTNEPIKDYEKCFDIFSAVADYITINISSPNTPGLRKLQKKSNLLPLLKNITIKRNLYHKKSKRKIPLALKISPDLNKLELINIVNLAIKYGIEGIIATNTSIDKSLLNDKEFIKKEGGLSGVVLFKHSNNILKIVSEHSKGKLEIIGVGGIDSAKKVLKKLDLGANSIQIYSSLVYKGINIVDRIIFDLVKLLNK
jgi:dihydroorotate dehydrogenase